jgi:hypothetical protein
VLGALPLGELRGLFGTLLLGQLFGPLPFRLFGTLLLGQLFGPLPFRQLGTPLLGQLFGPLSFHQLGTLLLGQLFGPLPFRQLGGADPGGLLVGADPHCGALGLLLRQQLPLPFTQFGLAPGFLLGCLARGHLLFGFALPARLVLAPLGQRPCLLRRALCGLLRGQFFRFPPLRLLLPGRGLRRQPFFLFPRPGRGPPLLILPRLPLGSLGGLLLAHQGQPLLFLLRLPLGGLGGLLLAHQGQPLLFLLRLRLGSLPFLLFGAFAFQALLLLERPLLGGKTLEPGLFGPARFFGRCLRTRSRLLRIRHARLARARCGAVPHVLSLVDAVR